MGFILEEESDIFVLGWIFLHQLFVVAGIKVFEKYLFRKCVDNNVSIFIDNFMKWGKKMVSDLCYKQVKNLINIQLRF